MVKAGEERIIETDYCSVGEISRKIERIPGFSVDVQEIMDMSNLALILGTELNTSGGYETIGMKRRQRTNPYQLFKFVTCPKDGLSNTFYFVKTALSGDVEVPVINLNRNDFAGVSLEFDVAEGGNVFIQKATATPVSEVQTITVDATGGTFTVTWNGQTTTALAFNISAVNFTNAMEALSNVGVGDVVVTGGPGNAGGTTPYTLTWNSALGNVSQPTTTATLLTGGAQTAVVATTTPGV